MCVKAVYSDVRKVSIFTNIFSLKNKPSNVCAYCTYTYMHIYTYKHIRTNHCICVCSQHLQLSFSYFTVLKNMNGPED